jgi:membrane-associated phospholipid phosphatase
MRSLNRLWLTSVLALVVALCRGFAGARGGDAALRRHPMDRVRAECDRLARHQSSACRTGPRACQQGDVPGGAHRRPSARRRRGRSGLDGPCAPVSRRGGPGRGARSSTCGCRRQSVCARASGRAPARCARRVGRLGCRLDGKRPGGTLPTPPGFISRPLEPLAGTWRTWNLRSGSQLRPGPPPAFRSPGFLAEVRQVYAVAQNLTAEHKRIADYWADGAGTATPAGHWNRIALDIVRAAGSPTLRASLLFSALNTTQADAFIASWDAKYTYWTLRPVTAIRQRIDPGWLSYLVTPPFPSYVSGHSTTSGAASTELAAFFPPRAGELKAMAEEAAVLRMYGGIHFNSDNQAGLELGRRLGTVAVQAYGFQAGGGQAATPSPGADLRASG